MVLRSSCTAVRSIAKLGDHHRAQAEILGQSALNALHHAQVTAVEVIDTDVGVEKIFQSKSGPGSAGGGSSGSGKSGANPASSRNFLLQVRLTGSRITRSPCRETTTSS